MKAYLLWDRFLRYWLPPDEMTGNVAQDIDRALKSSYGDKGHTFAQKGGLSIVIIDSETTLVASRVPPQEGTPLPNWLTLESKAGNDDKKQILDKAVRRLIARPRPHVILKTGKTLFTLDGIVLGEGTQVVVNEPAKITVTDEVRVRRARSALKVLRSVTAARNARALLRDRLDAAMGAGGTGQAVGEIDKQLDRMIGQLKVGPDRFFDAIELLEGVSDRELAVAGKPQ